MNKKIVNRYNGLDGLRTIAAFGIVAVHVAKNTGFSFEYFWYQGIICKLESFVNLFFILSAFSMCCGYYEQLKNNEISLNDFYMKRYKKIWPFFAVLVLLDTIYSWNGIQTFTDAFADLTLAFAFLPNSNISIIGVGWTLGVIFAFYMLFPFFVFCIWNKKRAWLTFIVAFIFDCFKRFYFSNGNSYVLCNILVWMIYFVLGGLIYLYKDKFINYINKMKKFWLLFSIILLILWFIIPNNLYNVNIFTLKTIIVSVAWILYAISVQSILLDNKICKFISGISFEIYLIHMLIYRVFQKIGFIKFMGTDSVVAFWIDFAFVITGSIIGAIIVKKIILCILALFEKNK